MQTVPNAQNYGIIKFKVELKKHCNLNSGVNRVLSDGEMDISFLELDIVVLNQGQTHRETLNEKEAVLTVLSGRGMLEAPPLLSGELLGIRKDVFSGRPEGAYLPAGVSFALSAQTPLEAAIFRAPASQTLHPYVIKEQKVRAEKRGGPNFTRHVTDLVGVDGSAARLIVGETISKSGNWSSYPPHKHDRDMMPEESELEEVYFFRIRPQNGFGMMYIYTQDGSIDQPLVIRNNDLVAIPKGYHPVAAAAGYEVYYLWGLAGKKRIMKVYEDPQHAWVNKTKTKNF